MNEAPRWGRRPAKPLGLWELGGLPCAGEGWTCSGGPGLGVASLASGETPELGTGCSRRGCVSRRVAPLPHPQGDGRFVPADSHRRKFDVRPQRPTLEDVCGQDWVGVPYKLLAGFLGSDILNVTYCRLFLKIGSHLNVLNTRLLPAMEGTFQKSLEMTSLFFQLMLLQ